MNKVALAAPTVAPAVMRFADAVRETYGDAVVELRLFGSHARSSAHEESDVDVAVVLDEAGWEIRRDVIDLATDVGIAHGLSLSPTVFDRAEYERWRSQDRALTRDIEEEGIPL